MEGETVNLIIQKRQFAKSFIGQPMSFVTKKLKAGKGRETVSTASYSRAAAFNLA